MLLADRTPAQDPLAAEGGALPHEWARALSAPFVLHPEYGTRCSTVLLLEGGGGLQLAGEWRGAIRGVPERVRIGEQQVESRPGRGPRLERGEEVAGAPLLWLAVRAQKTRDQVAP